MPDFNNPVNGDSFDVELVISSLGTKLTKHDKLAIAVLPTHEFKGDVLLVTPEDMSRMARLVSSPDRFTLADSVNGASDQSKLSMTITWCEAGQPIGTDDNGQPIVSNAGFTTFQKSFWDTSDMEIIPSLDAQFAINKLNEKVNLEYALRQREQSLIDDSAAKVRRSKKSLKRANKVETLNVDTTESTESTDPII